MLSQSPRLFHRCLHLCHCSHDFPLNRWLKYKSKTTPALLSTGWKFQAGALLNKHPVRDVRVGTAWFFFDNWWENLQWHNFLGSGQTYSEVTNLENAVVGFCHMIHCWIRLWAIKNYFNNQFQAKGDGCEKSMPEKLGKAPCVFKPRSYTASYRTTLFVPKLWKEKKRTTVHVNRWDDFIGAHVP